MCLFTFQVLRFIAVTSGVSKLLQMHNDSNKQVSAGFIQQHRQSAGLEDEPEDTAPVQQERQMRYDDEGLDSEDDFIDDDIGDGAQGQQPRRARSKIRTDGVHSQAVQVCQLK